MRKTGQCRADHLLAHAEFAVQNFTGTGATQATLSQINQFMDIVVAWMETVEYVERYFWFGAMYDMVSVRIRSCSSS